MLPEAAQARKAIWEAINPHTGIRRIDEAFPKEIRENTREQEMMIRFKNGSTWQVVGSDNYNSLIGSPPYGVVFSEWSVGNPSSWPYLRPILAENGGWAMFIYTARGKNHGYSTFNMANKSSDWFCQKLTVDETGVFSKESLQRELDELRSEYGEEEGEAYYNQEYYCSFEAAIPGSYYIGEINKVQKEGRVTKVLYDESVPVETWWDIGKSDYTSIWFSQNYGNEVRVIDYEQFNNKKPSFYTDMLSKKGYHYGTHHLPHDAGYDRFEGCAFEQLRALKPEWEWLVHDRTPSVNADINRVRVFFSRCVFDADKCESGLECLRSYRKKYNNAKKCFENEPYHDWASHGADAFRYLAVHNKASAFLDLKKITDDRGFPTINAWQTSSTKSNRI
jgi:hypothetical protein